MKDRSKKYDCHPEIRIELNGDELQVVNESKILGLYIMNTLRWNKHIQYICSKASSKLWAMWRLMKLGLEYEVILDCYYKEVRSILEYDAILFHSVLSKKLSKQIEATQKQFLGALQVT